MPISLESVLANSIRDWDDFKGEHDEKLKNNGFIIFQVYFLQIFYF